MLWKLADNVKYEDDCEVSVERDSRRERERERCRLTSDKSLTFNVKHRLHTHKKSSKVKSEKRLREAYNCNNKTHFQNKC